MLDFSWISIIWSGIVVYKNLQLEGTRCLGKEEKEQKWLDVD